MESFFIKTNKNLQKHIDKTKIRIYNTLKQTIFRKKGDFYD